ncbi:MAG: ABC transporter substrate-binding protein, partial [Planctomycetota bacterium]
FRSAFTVSIVAACLIFLSGCRKKPPPEQEMSTKPEGVMKKVVWVDSYHEGYPWSDGIEEGIQTMLNIVETEDGSLESPDNNLSLRIFRMDTKNNTSEEFKQQAGLKAKAFIESWSPDIVICADDNAFKYLVMPFYKNADLPFVFCGVNWDVSKYDNAPYDNTTGMIEVWLVDPLIKQLHQYAEGKRVGYMVADIPVEKEIVQQIQEKFQIHFDETVFLKTFEDWKREYLRLQNDVDILIWANNAGIADWDDDLAQTFVLENTRIPTGSISPWMTPFVLISLTQVPQEQGQWAAKAVLDILNGKSPKDIPLAANKQGKMFLNMALARKLGIKFPLELIERSHMVAGRRKKILFVNSYHQGYFWSDSLEAGLFKSLDIKLNKDGSPDDSQSNIDLEIFRMDTKLNTAEQFKIDAGLQAKDIIDTWQPDMVITSDDNAAKYLIVPYLKELELPVVFCGINWDASIYGLPCRNVTGMIEQALVKQTIESLSSYAAGSRIGYIGADVFTGHKEIGHYKTTLGLSFTDGGLVSTFDEWKQLYLQLQESVDMVVLVSHVGIPDWNDAQALRFIMENTTIPSGTTLEDVASFALISRTRIAEEQGWAAGKMALEILAGKSPSEIPVETNRQSKLYLNMALSKKLGITFPMDLIEESLFVEEQ